MQRNSNPRCSVIVPAFNAAGTITRAIQSILAQTDPDFEILIVDDGSTDHTVSTVQDQLNDPRIKLHILADNQGAAIARNTALAMARGRYIAFLDADDLWLPTKLERQLTVMTDTGAELCFSAFLRRTFNRDRRVDVPIKVAHRHLLCGNVIGCLTAIYDTQRLGKMPMPNIRLRQDYALWLSILRRTQYAIGLDEVLAIHHRFNQSLSSNLIANAQGSYHVLRHLEQLSPLQATACLMSHYANRARMIRPCPDMPEAPRICDTS